MPTKTPSLFGCAMIIASTVIGAGMLANPTATSGVWFTSSLAVLLYTWFSMLSSGLMILEVNTHYPHGASFDTMVKDLLGRGWNIINGIAVALRFIPAYLRLYLRRRRPDRQRHRQRLGRQCFAYRRTTRLLRHPRLLRMGIRTLGRPIHQRPHRRHGINLYLGNRRPDCRCQNACFV